MEADSASNTMLLYKIDDKRSYEDFFYEKYKSKWGDNRVEFIDNLPEMAEIMQKVM